MSLKRERELCFWRSLLSYAKLCYATLTLCTRQIDRVDWDTTPASAFPHDHPDKPAKFATYKEYFEKRCVSLCVLVPSSH
jgi:hypothetical protein